MNSAVVQKLTIDEFLEWEDRQEFKHEFDDVGVVAMVGGTAAHSIIQGNLAFQLVGRLAGKPCRFFGDWVGHILKRDAILAMPEVGVSLPLLELYAGLEP